MEGPGPALVQKWEMKAMEQEVQAQALVQKSAGALDLAVQAQVLEPKLGQLQGWAALASPRVHVCAYFRNGSLALGLVNRTYDQ